MQVATSSTPLQLLAPVSSRTAVILQNQGSVDIFFAFRNNVSHTGANSGIRLSAGEIFTIASEPQDTKMASGFKYGASGLWVVSATAGVVSYEVFES